MSESIVKIIERRFQSANSTPVERAHITADEWQRLGNELRERLENEGLVRQKACKADLDRALARVAELRIQLSDMTGCSCDPENPCKYHAMVTESGRKHVLRKQAEAVDEVTRLYVPGGMARTSLEEYASRLRQQADQQESTHD